AALPPREAEVGLLRPRRDAEESHRERPPRRAPRSRGHKCRDPPNARRQPHGRGPQVLHGSRRFRRPRARTPPRRPRPALGPAGGESGHILPHARPEPAPGLAYGAVLHAGGVRALLAHARSGPAAQDPAPVYPPRRDAALALPG